MPILADSLFWTFAPKLLGAGVLAIFVTVIAYIHDPRLKMLVFSMPVPFTCAYLVTGVTIDSTALSGVVLVTAYHWIVYVIAVVWGLPLALGIGVSVGTYIATAWLTKDFIKPIPIMYSAVVVIFLLGLVSYLYKPIVEDGHRSRSPWYVKLPLIYVIAVGIYSITSLLAGAVTTFPYAGVFTSYEMRRSLRTLAGQYTINNFSFLAMFLAIAMGEHLAWPKPLPLAAGWAAIIITIWTIYYFEWGKPKAA